MEEQNGQSLTDMDEKIKSHIIDLWNTSTQAYILGDKRSCFYGFRMIFNYINCENFSNKEYLQELTNILVQFFSTYDKKLNTERDKVQFLNKESSIKELLDEYLIEIPKALKELNLWLKTIIKYPDSDSTLSMENFGSEKSTLNEKIKEMEENLKIKEIFKLISYEEIHNIYARWKLK